MKLANFQFPQDKLGEFNTEIRQIEMCVLGRMKGILIMIFDFK